MDNLPPTYEGHETKDAGSVPEHHAEEPLALLAAALARSTQYHAQVVEQNRILVQVKDTLAEAIVAFSSLANSTIQAEGRLQATAERIETSIQLFGARQQEFLAVLNSHIKRFTTLLIWTLVLATFGAAAAFIAILLPILTAR